MQLQAKPETNRLETGTGLLTRREAAEYLNVSLRWLEECAAIPRVNLARPDAKRATIRYRKSDLDAFIESRLVASATQGVG